MATNEGLARLLSSAIERAVSDVLDSQRVSGTKQNIYTCGVYDLIVNLTFYLTQNLIFNMQTTTGNDMRNEPATASSQNTSTVSALFIGKHVESFIILPHTLYINTHS
jgi:hypothetical protein